MKLIMQVSMALMLMFIASKVGAQTDCTPRPGGGYSCYDSNRGVYIDITPRLGGGYSTYDYGTGTYRDTTPRLVLQRGFTPAG